jgi:predicted dehydrogenase
LLWRDYNDSIKNKEDIPVKKVTFAFLGMGNRGINYSSKVERFPEEMEVVAIADLRRDRLETANKIFNLPEDRLFNSAEELLAQPKMADILVVASQDQQHREHAIAAMEAGYDLLRNNCYHFMNSCLYRE